VRAPGLIFSESDRQRWREADRASRPARVERLRHRLGAEGFDAFFGLRPENGRYLTGFVLADGEEKVSGASGRFIVSADEVIVLADSRYRLQAEEQCPGARIEEITTGFATRWTEIVAGVAPLTSDASGGALRVAVEASHLSHAGWLALAEAASNMELVPIEGWVEELRATKEPAETERVKAACAVADAALEATLAEIRPGVTEQDLALALEWRMRTGGAEALAFEVACLAGERAALPHGSPSNRAVARGEVLLFDFGAQVDGYRSDMTRTLFVGEPTARDLDLYRLVARAQEASLALLRDSLARNEVPTNREVDTAAREVIEAAGHGSDFGHGTGHGIGLATHELPSLGQRAPEAPLPSPTVFSVEPGVYLDGETGVRIEDLVVFDSARGGLEVLTGFSRDVTVVGA
jgi:Xaa-Pro aminopeptidase